LDSLCPTVVYKLHAMKLKYAQQSINQNDGKLIAAFGQARLVQTGIGKYELHGGSSDDRQQAQEWISLFMHEAVVAR